MSEINYLIKSLKKLKKNVFLLYSKVQKTFYSSKVDASLAVSVSADTISKWIKQDDLLYQ